MKREPDYDITTAAERDALLGGTPTFSPLSEEDWWRVQAVVDGHLTPAQATEERREKGFVQSLQVEMFLSLSGVPLPKLEKGDMFGFGLPASDPEGFVREVPEVGIWHASTREIITEVNGVNLAERFWEFRSQEQFGELHMPHPERELAGAGSKERL